MRFIDNHDWQGLPNEIDGAVSTGFFIRAIHDVDEGFFLFRGLVVLFFVPKFVDGSDRHDHELEVRAGGEVAHLAEVSGVVNEGIEGHAGVERLEVVFHHLDGFEDALFDGDGGDDDDELGEAVELIEFKGGAEIDVGFAGACFHLDGEVAAFQFLGGFDAVADLDFAEVFENVLGEEREAVAVASGVAFEFQLLLGAEGVAGDGELAAGDFLATEEIADAGDGVLLVVEIGFEVEFHEVGFQSVC